jgi:hypothetical protein
MSNSAKKPNETPQRKKGSLAEQYEEIGIKAVAAAVKFGKSKNSHQTSSSVRKAERRSRASRTGRDE